MNGPLNENGLPPASKTMTRIEMNENDQAVVKCQLTFANETGTYNGRLRLYLTTDAKVCELRTGCSNTGRDDECKDIECTYDFNPTANCEMTFTYNITKSSRIHASVVTCGVNYHPGGGQDSDCYGDKAALIVLPEAPTCITPLTTEQTTTLTEEQTTTPTEEQTTIRTDTTTVNNESSTTESSTTTTTDDITTTITTATVEDPSAFILLPVGTAQGVVIVVLLLVIVILTAILLWQRRVLCTRACNESNQKCSTIIPNNTNSESDVDNKINGNH